MRPDLLKGDISVPSATRRIYIDPIWRVTVETYLATGVLHFQAPQGHFS